MPTRPDSAEKIARRLSALERTVKTRLRRGQLGHSSYEGRIQHYVGDQLSTVIGKQYDGTAGAVAVAGPTPPRPTAPAAVAVPGGLQLSWNGGWDPAEVLNSNGASTPVVAPLDFARVETEVSTSPDFLAGETRPGPWFSSAAGGEMFLSWPVPGAILYVRSYTRAVTGKVSARSLTVGPVAAGRTGIAHLDFDLADYVAGHSVSYGTVAPTDPGVGALWLQEVSAGPPPEYLTMRWDGDSWEEVANQGVTSSLAAAIAAQNAANAKAQIFRQADPPAAGEIVGDKAVWFDSDNGNRAHDWSGSAWVPQLLGNGSIQTQSLIASDVFATGTITAPLLDVLLVLATVIIAGDPNGEHTRLDPTGLSAYATDPGTGLPQQVARLGRALGIIDPGSGIPVATINEQGFFAGKGASFEAEDDFFVGGLTLAQRLWELPWGNVGKAVYPATGGVSTTTNSELEFLELSFELQPGRSYSITSDPIEFTHTSVVGGTGSGGAFYRARYTSDDGATAPTLSSPILKQVAISPLAASWPGRHDTAFHFDGPPLGEAPQIWRILLTYGAGNGSQGVGIWRGDPIEFRVKDDGPIRPNVGVLRTGGGGGAGAVKTRKVQTFEATWGRSWRQNNTTVSFENVLYQGYGDSLNGAQRSSCGFEDLTGILTGATIEKVELYLYAEHWWYADGGTARIGYHGTLAKPASFPGHSGIFLQGFARNQARWVDVTQWGSVLKSGACRGVSLGNSTTDREFYGRFRGFGSSSPPLLRVTYVK